MTDRDQLTQRILEDIFNNVTEEKALLTELNKLMELGWSEDQVLLMLEVMALELAKITGNVAEVSKLIGNFHRGQEEGNKLAG